jgi:hypothetical protein
VYFSHNFIIIFKLKTDLKKIKKQKQNKIGVIPAVGSATPSHYFEGGKSHPKIDRGWLGHHWVFFFLIRLKTG